VVVVANVEEREVAAGLTFVGQVVPSRRSIVGSAVDGRVEELLVNDGDPVSTVEQGNPPRHVGQPIVQLLTETISIEVAAAKAALDLRRREMDEWEAGSRPEEIAQALARLEAAKALSEFSQMQYQRVKLLHERSNSSRRLPTPWRRIRTRRPLRQLTRWPSKGRATNKWLRGVRGWPWLRKSCAGCRTSKANSRFGRPLKAMSSPS
jgi:hypothetical protein